MSTDSTAPGSCTITLQNPLVLKTAGGTQYWERFYYKTGRYIDGTRVWYLSKKPSKWYCGKLKKVNSPEEATIVLDEIPFKVMWEGDTPEEQILPSDTERFFAEEMGEPILEPMQKFKVYAVNRFPYDLLSKYDYKSVFEKSMSSTAAMLLFGASPTRSQTPETSESEGSGLYASPIFTGYICDVSHRQEGANWYINIVGKDVTCWLDYSRLNVNPSLNVWGQDVAAEAFRSEMPIYTIKYAGMSARDIITSLFLGGSAADVSTSAKLYTSSAGTEEVTGIAGISVPVSGRVTLHNTTPVNNRYRVTTSDGYTGWIDKSVISRTYSVYTGVGNFVLDSSVVLPVYEVGTPIEQLYKKMLPDKLAVDPIFEREKDDAVYQSYRYYFRQNWPTYQSDYITRRDVVNTVCKTTNTECYADGDGKVWFHPIWAYHSVTSPVYVLHKEDVISWSFTFSDREVVTWVQATGEFDFNALPTGMLFSQVFETPEMVGRFGIRGAVFRNPNLRNVAACRAFAEAMMRRLNANIVTGTVTMVLRPELHLARNVYIPWLNAIGYIAAIEHQIQYGSRATTTLDLKYVRRPWEPWTVINYEGDSDVDYVGPTSKETTFPSYGTTLQGANLSVQKPVTSTERSDVSAASPTKKETK
jgi:hypothetical protein